MRFALAVDAYIADMKAEGRINSENTILAYRTKLNWLGETVDNRDPAKVGYEDVKRALGRWHGNSRRQAHAIYRSFFRWCQYEQIRTTNPAEAVRPTRSTKPTVTRLSREETAQLLKASEDDRRDRWVAYLGCYAGLRRNELCRLQARHFARKGTIWVSKDLGKGGKERWIPVISDLAPVVAEIQSLITDPEAYVLPGRRSAGHPTPRIMHDTNLPLSTSALYKQVRRLGERAGLQVPVTPHTLRHSFCTYVTRHAGISVAQTLMGHESIKTTEGYTGKPTLEELQISLHGFSFFDAKSPKGART